mmetsp:Transcript_3330/g.3674  ORF Transcript_3330/g.3674 Transcript_3330/m.3674 type:complete len:928 (-) Transcript_3330:725-3508(-)
MKFDRPIGAAADAKELEYVAALHQTSHSDEDGDWMDGSINDKDVRAFLMSRHGIKTSEEEVRKVIFSGLAGGEGEDDCIDIVEMVSILVIPLLLKVAKGNERKVATEFSSAEDFNAYMMLEDEREKLAPPPSIISDVLRNILIDAEESLSKPPKLTNNLIRHIFSAFDELGLITDDNLIEEMINGASGGNPDVVLDAETFARALTHDITLYNTDNETSASTHFDDVFKAKEPVASSQDNQDTEKKGLDTSAVSSANSTYTFPEIDFMADNFNSWEHVVIVWATLIISYVVYIFLNGKQSNLSPCDSDSFGCKITKSLVSWVQIMLQLVIMGTGVGSALSIGNKMQADTVYGPLVGLVAVAVFIFLPKFYEFDANVSSGDQDANIFSTNMEESYPGMARILIPLGVLLSLIQIKNIIAIVISNEKLSKNRFLARLFLGSNVQAEFRIKQAASYKVNQMISNAYTLHKEDEKSSRQTSVKKAFKTTTTEVSTQESALMNFTKISEKTEEIGGLIWAWKEVFTGSLQTKEGIWLHTRLIAGNMAQFIFIFVVLGYSIMVLGGIIKEVYTVQFSPCKSTFDYNSCYFPYSEVETYTGTGLCLDVELDGTTNENGGNACYDSFVPVGGSLGTNTCNMLNELKGIFYSTDKCTDVLSAADDQLNAQGFNVSDLHGCEKLLNLATIYGDGGSDIFNQTDIMTCTDYINNVTSAVESSFNASALSEYSLCMETPSHFLRSIDMCEIQVFQTTSVIKSYEKSYTDETEFCESVLSYCVPYFNNTGACLIGMRNLLPFQFEGVTCEDYPDINNILEYKDQITTLFPEKWMLQLSATLAIIVGFFGAFMTAAVYIPSAVHTLLKFRSGVIPSLRSKSFLAYRTNLEHVTLMIGAMFWGMIVTTLLMIIVVAGGVFFLVWQVSRPYVIDIIALVIGENQ